MRLNFADFRMESKAANSIVNRSAFTSGYSSRVVTEKAPKIASLGIETYSTKKTGRSDHF